MKTSAKYKTSLHFHFEVGVQGKNNSLKGLVESVRDKVNNKDYQNLFPHKKQLNQLFSSWQG